MSLPHPMATFTRILIICTGNICRSPMAAAVLQARSMTDSKIQSAGTGALIGHPVDELAQAVLAERGMDLRGHRARQVSMEHLRWANLILVMEADHLNAIHAMDLTTRGKTFLMGHWIGLDNIQDPYGGNRVLFERTLSDIDATVASWIDKL